MYRNKLFFFLELLYHRGILYYTVSLAWESNNTLAQKTKQTGHIRNTYKADQAPYIKWKEGAYPQ